MLPSAEVERRILILLVNCENILMIPTVSQDS